MQVRNKLALACHGYVVFWNFVLGLVYLCSPQIMPWHQQATGTDWDGLPPHYQVLLLAFLRATGAGSLAVGAALAFLVLVPFRRGERWAQWAIPLVGLLYWVPVQIAGMTVRSLSSLAAPGTYVGLSCIIMLAIGFLMLLPGGMKKQPY